jgi:hypothetical protein
MYNPQGVSDLAGGEVVDPLEDTEILFLEGI